MVHRHIEPKPRRGYSWRMRCGNCGYPVEHAPRLHTFICRLVDRLRPVDNSSSDRPD